MGWYQYQPNVELLKQANMWEGLSQSVKDFLSGAEQNEAFKLNKQQALLDMDNTKAHTGLLGTQTRAQEQQIQHNAELHPLQMEGTKTQNAFNKKQYGLLEAYGDKEAQARIADMIASTGYKQAALAGQGGRDTLSTAYKIIQMANALKLSPKQEEERLKELEDKAKAVYGLGSKAGEAARDLYYYGQIGKAEPGGLSFLPWKWGDSYKPFAEGKSAQELERYRMLNNPAMQLQNAALGLLGYGNQWWGEAPLEIDENWGENLKNMMK